MVSKQFIFQTFTVNDRIMNVKKQTTPKFRTSVRLKFGHFFKLLKQTQPIQTAYMYWPSSNSDFFVRNSDMCPNTEHLETERKWTVWITNLLSIQTFTVVLYLNKFKLANRVVGPIESTNLWEWGKVRTWDRDLKIWSWDRVPTGKNFCSGTTEEVKNTLLDVFILFEIIKPNIVLASPLSYTKPAESY